MGFIIAKLETLRDGSVQIERVRPVGFIGRRGFFARNLDLLTASDDGMWNITREALLRAIEPDAVPGTTLLFDLTPELEKLNVYELVDITGHTSTESTDAILHFKIVCSSLRKSSVQREDGTLAVRPGAAPASITTSRSGSRAEARAEHGRSRSRIKHSPPSSCARAEGGAARARRLRPGRAQRERVPGRASE